MADRRKLDITLRPGKPPLLKERVVEAVDVIAKAAWRAHEQGQCHLVQERLLPERAGAAGHGVVAYIAVKRTTVGAMAEELKRHGLEDAY